jgi:hypothetical protein
VQKLYFIFYSKIDRSTTAASFDIGYCYWLSGIVLYLKFTTDEQQNQEQDNTNSFAVQHQ